MNTAPHTESATGSAAPSLDKDPRRIEGMFDAIAHRYDQLNHLLSVGLDRRWRRQAVAALDLPDGALVIDVCTGTADLAITAARHRAAPHSVIGIDFAGAMLVLGRRKILADGLGDVVRLVRGDACRLPSPSMAVDAVTVGFGIRNVADIELAIA